MQDIIARLRVMDVETLRTICFPVFDSDSDFDRQTLRRHEIGAIVTIEQSAAEEGSASALESWRLSPRETTGITRYYSELFHTDLPGKEALRDLFMMPRDDEWILLRAGLLAKDLKYASDFFSSPENSDRKLIVHCINGHHRSPALALAILLDQFPQMTSQQALTSLQEISSKPPQLRKGEIAFIDAYFGLMGDLVKARAAMPYADPKVFNLGDSLALRGKFSQVLGPIRADEACLRPTAQANL